MFHYDSILISILILLVYCETKVVVIIEILILSIYCNTHILCFRKDIELNICEKEKSKSEINELCETINAKLQIAIDQKKSLEDTYQDKNKYVQIIELLQSTQSENG